LYWFNKEAWQPGIMALACLDGLLPLLLKQPLQALELSAKQLRTASLSPEAAHDH
jgi:hypothetical protein